jgi:hypothetical protein
MLQGMQKKKKSYAKMLFYLLSRESSGVGTLDDDVAVINVHPLLKLDPFASLLCSLLLTHGSTHSLLAVYHFLQLFLQNFVAIYDSLFFVDIFLYKTSVFSFCYLTYHTLSCVKVNEAEIHFVARQLSSVVKTY